jgi:hypothetical protein
MIQLSSLYELLLLFFLLFFFVALALPFAFWTTTYYLSSPSYSPLSYYSIITYYINGSYLLIYYPLEALVLTKVVLELLNLSLYVFVNKVLVGVEILLIKSASLS